MQAKLFDDLTDLISFYQNSESGCNVDLRSHESVKDHFLVAYEAVKGNNYNDQMAFSQETMTCIVNILRSYHRYILF